jgi:hypothetical protein
VGPVIDESDDLVSRTIPTLGVQGRRGGVMYLTIDAIADVANPSDKVIASANRLIGEFEMVGRMVSTRHGLRNIV